MGAGVRQVRASPPGAADVEARQASGAWPRWRSAACGGAACPARRRDFAHLAVTLCRCMIGRVTGTGYLGDIGVPLDESTMAFSGWFEVYLGGRWYTFDARHNKPRIGRILMARERDATDVAIVTSFRPCTLASFKVIAHEVTSAAPASL
jgi:hypothetical protein